MTRCNEKNWCVYKHTNKINGKSYIGITSKEPEKRWGVDGSRYFSQHFGDAIRKYGWDNFTHEIIYIGLTMEQASQKEKELIALYDSYHNGYNCTNGGIDGFPENRCKSVICLNDFKIYNSIVEAGELNNIEPVYIMRCCQKKIKYTTNNTQWMYLDEYEQIGINIKPICKTTKSVICLETKEVYDSARKAGESLNISVACINACCSHSIKSAGGLHWVYLEDYNEDIEIPVDKKRGKAVICVETNEIYPSVREAGRKNNIDPSLIVRSCKNSNLTAASLHWKYAEVL